MESNQPITLTRDCEAVVIPVGTPVTLQKGETAHITQSLGGSYTVIVNGNMFRIEGKNADALGFEAPATPASTDSGAAQGEHLEKQVWDAMRGCFDPEIPVNIVELGLIYDCQLESMAEGSHRVNVKMTLTAPGCGMGPMIQQDVQNKLLGLEGVDEANVELVWDPPWNQSMMSDAAKLQLGMY